MFVHTVFFWLNNPDSAADHQALRKGLDHLRLIDYIQESYIGTPADTRRDVIDYSYNLGLTFVFSDKAAQDAYQEHPIHLKFIEDCGHLWQRVQVYDVVTD